MANVFSNDLSVRANGQVIEASWFNSIRTALANNVEKSNFTATTDPGVGDDDADNYGVGSVWINTTSDTAFICLDASTGAAVWQQVSDLKNNLAATVSPTANEDSADGYSAGSIWVDVTGDNAYICLDASTGAAVWKIISGPLGNLSATNAPGVGDDDADGYTPGSFWIDVTNDVAYVCLDASTGAAVWKTISNLTNNFAATNNPGVGDDDADGYSAGSIWVDTTNDIAYICLDASTGAAVWQQIGAGSGAGGINYITNPDAENDASDYSTYDDSTAFVDGTGGTSSNLTFTRNTTTPLRGDGDFSLAKGAAVATHEGLSSDFTIDLADRGKILRITFDYTVTQNYADDDLELYVYDVTNSRIIRPLNAQIKASSLNEQHVAEFQSSSDSTSYRLAFHVADTTSNSWTFAFDNLQVGPRFLARGAISTDWQGFTPTGTWVSNASYTGYYRRNGDSLDMTIEVTLSGTPNSSTLEVDLPSGLVIDSNKIEENQPVGTVTLNGAGASDYIGIAATNSSNTAIRPTYVINDAGTRVRSFGFTATAPVTYSSGDFISIEVKGLPIDGWSGSGMVSVDEGTRQIIVRGEGNGAGSVTGGSTAIDFTEVEDTSAAWDGTTFTAPEKGQYLLSAQAMFTTSANRLLALYKSTDGGSTYTETFENTPNTSGQRTPFNHVVSLNKGDKFQLRCNVNATLSDVSDRHYIHIQKLATPQTIFSDVVYSLVESTSSSNYSATASPLSASTWYSPGSGFPLTLTKGTWIIEIQGSTGAIVNSASTGNQITIGTALATSSTAGTGQIENFETHHFAYAASNMSYARVNHSFKPVVVSQSQTYYLHIKYDNFSGSPSISEMGYRASSLSDIVFRARRIAL